MAAELLLLAGQDLAAAVDRFYSKEEEEGVRGRDNTGRAANNEVIVDQIDGQASSSGGVKRKAEVIILDDEEASLDSLEMKINLLRCQLMLMIILKTMVN